jgi:DNA-binding YbaB/EbfC family protein
MKGNIGQMMKQAQMMQENMRRMQEQLGTIEVEGLSGSGMVKVHDDLQARGAARQHRPFAHRRTAEMLEDLLVAAINDAARKVEATVAEKMGSLTAGMGLPAGLETAFLGRQIVESESEERLCSRRGGPRPAD